MFTKPAEKTVYKLTGSKSFSDETLQEIIKMLKFISGLEWVNVRDTKGDIYKDIIQIVPTYIKSQPLYNVVNELDLDTITRLSSCGVVIKLSEKVNDISINVELLKKSYEIQKIEFERHYHMIRRFNI